MFDSKKLGIRIACARGFRNLTADQLVAYLPIKSGGEYISKYETGKRSPGLESLVTMCNVLRVSPDYLLRDYLNFYPYINDEELEGKIKNISPRYLPLLEKTVEELIQLSQDDDNI